MDLESNLKNLRARVKKASEHLGRDPESIDILPVTKHKPPQVIETLQAHGFRRFGENYIKEIQTKAGLLPHAEWVATGHLQTNKALLATRLCSTILSLDSLRLAKSLDRESQSLMKNLIVWIQVDLWEQEPLKGCRRSEVPLLLDFIARAPYLRFGGLMVLPPIGEDKAFRDSDRYRRDMEQTSQIKIPLSMGMSEDFESAIRHGSDQIRIGSALLGPR